MERLCVARIVGVHGVKGLVRVKSFTREPDAFAAYGPLRDEAGVGPYALTVRGEAKGTLLCAVDGVADRSGAEALKGISLYCPRDALPDDLLEEDEFFHADLIGLRVDHVDGRSLGEIRAVHDFGAGDVLEVRLDGVGKTVYLPFTLAAAPVVDLAAGLVQVDPPFGLLPGEDKGDADGDQLSGSEQGSEPESEQASGTDAEMDAEPGPEEAFR